MTQQAQKRPSSAVEDFLSERVRPPSKILTEDNLMRLKANLQHIHQLTLGSLLALIPFLVWGIYNLDFLFSAVVFALMAMSGYLCWVARR